MGYVLVDIKKNMLFQTNESAIYCKALLGNNLRLKKHKLIKTKNKARYMLDS